ncbi:hypothetical protein AVEN_2131-1 [Araneus ventricosus]|uniref:Uncharacterized protein n=1 Tax=Araneus ventricosus TaxID=182803 RepID=A0A4Y2E9F2_ARAVE|nr:hypothetical protein AVEN_2131-1 [Araneus ventricosus]
MCWKKNICRTPAKWQKALLAVPAAFLCLEEEYGRVCHRDLLYFSSIFFDAFRLYEVISTFGEAEDRKINFVVFLCRVSFLALIVVLLQRSSCLLLELRRQIR